MTAQDARDIRWGIRVARGDRRRLAKGEVLVGNVAPQRLTRRAYAREWVRRVETAPTFTANQIAHK